MAISELQIALIGAGVAAIAAVWGYNVWQERRHRKAAEKIFKGGQDDALLAADKVPATAVPAARASDDGERREPRISAAPLDFDLSLGDDDPVAPMVELEPPAESVPPPVEALLPPEYADSVTDCVLRLTTAEAIPAVQAMQNAQTGAPPLTKPVHWLAWSPADGAWQALAADAGGRYRDWAVSLQLVDRQGPVTTAELAAFCAGMQQLAQQAGATLDLPEPGEIALRAGRLDEFCAAVDIQFVLHIVESTGGVFAGSKLRGVAEAAGLALEPDGVFRARDEAGAAVFTVANLNSERLEADTIKALATHGLTLILDVPRVADGVLAFDRMLATARQLAKALGGVLVDAQRAPLSDAMIAAIRAKTAELQQRMRDGSIVPGSVRALRLFS